jgi:hypothetical protein
MSFRDFTLPKAQLDFGLTTDATQRLFPGVAPVTLSETMRPYLDDFRPPGMSVPTEKGRSELLVAPLLAEGWRRWEHLFCLRGCLKRGQDSSNATEKPAFFRPSPRVLSPFQTASQPEPETGGEEEPE